GASRPAPSPPASAAKPASPEATAPATHPIGVRVGLGYVGGVGESEARAVVSERLRGGPFSSISDLAARCGASFDVLERLAWAGACDALVSHGRREALWLLGVSAPGVRVPEGVQLALPLDGEAPGLREMTPWERLVADYGSTK